jgi:two-component system sensor kinase FixL
LALTEGHLSTKSDLLTAVIDTVVDGLVVIDRHGLIRAFNPACERMFAYRAAEVMGRNASMLMPPPYGEEYHDYLRRYHETGQKRMTGVSREVQGLRKDGTMFPMDLAIGEVEHGDEFGFVGIIRDITEQKGPIKRWLRRAPRPRPRAERNPNSSRACRTNCARP